MKSAIALRLLAEVTAHQWGMVTSAQVGVHGITRLDLSRLAEAGLLERVAHGVYRDTGVPADPLDDLRAVWLSTQPQVTADVRLKDGADGVVVAGTSAARLHAVGDLRTDRHEFVSPNRRQSQRAEIHYRLRLLDPRDVTVVGGLPVMTLERTIADLVEEVGDLSLVADALRDATLKRNLELSRLRELLVPLAKRHGFEDDDGAGFLTRLQQIAGIDEESVARRVAADPALGFRVAATYFSNLSQDDLVKLFGNPAMQEAFHSLGKELADRFRAALNSEMKDTLHSVMTQSESRLGSAMMRVIQERPNPLEDQLNHIFHETTGPKFSAHANEFAKIARQSLSIDTIVTDIEPASRRPSTERWSEHQVSGTPPSRRAAGELDD